MLNREDAMKVAYLKELDYHAHCLAGDYFAASKTGDCDFRSVKQHASALRVAFKPDPNNDWLLANVQQTIVGALSEIVYRADCAIENKRSEFLSCDEAALSNAKWIHNLIEAMIEPNGF